MVIMDSLKYCQAQKGLSIFAYCLMSNHLHLFCRADGTYTVSEIMRDFKKFTSKKIIGTLQSEQKRMDAGIF
jgi:REP element-mobilizing transposase RayT